MLSETFSSCLFLLLAGVPSWTTHAESNYTAPNYIVDKYEGSVTFYAYPMNICLQTGSLVYDEVIYTCNEDGTQVTKTVYEKNGGCSVKTSETTYDASDITDKGQYDFNCDGVHSYMKLQVCPVTSSTAPASCTATTCTFGSVAYSVPDICSYSGDGTTELMLSAECNSSNAAVTVYEGLDMCNGDVSEEMFSTADDCTFFGTQTASGITVQVYAELLECVIDGSLPSTTSDETDNNDQADEDSAMLICINSLVLFFCSSHLIISLVSN